MKILKLHIQNLNSLRGDIEIDFDKEPLNLGGLFAITGDTGAGKTTILDTLTLALYGKIPRNKDVKEVISYGSTACLAEVEFEHDKAIYRSKWSIWRARSKVDGNILGPKRELARYDPKQDLFDIIAEKVREVDDLVEQITGLDYDRFRRSVLLAQGDFSAFLDADEGARSELLERITGTEIYSDLSKAAFQRNKVEEQKLLNINQELRLINIFSSEEVKGFEKQKADIDQEIQTLQKELEGKKKLIQAQEEIHQLQKEISRLVAEKTRLAHQKEALAPQLEQLKVFEKIRPLSGVLEWIEEKEKEIKSLPEHIEKQQNQVDQLKASSTTLDAQIKTDKSKLAQLKTDLPARQLIWEETTALDIKVQSLSPNLLQLEKEVLQLEEHIQSSEESLQKLQKENQQNKQLFSSLNQWKTDHAILQDLEVKLPLIKEKNDQLLKQGTLLDKLKIDAKGHENRLIEKKKDLQVANTDLVKLQKQLSKEEELFSKNSGEEVTPTRESLLKKLEKEILWKEKNKDYQDRILKLASTYEKQLQDSQEILANTNEIRAKEGLINNVILNSIDLLKELEDDLTYKQGIYHQQQLLANYEKDRHQLEPGEPCPLCGSLEHPFTHEHLQPFTDRAKKDYEIAVQKLQSHKKRYSNLLHKQGKISESLKEFQNQDDLSKKQLDQTESEIAELIHKLGWDDFAVGSQLNFFQKRFLSDQKKLAHQIEQQATLQQVHSKLLDLEKKEFQTLEGIKNNKIQLDVYEERLNENLKEIENQEKLYFKAKSDFDTIVQAFISDDNNSTPEILSFLDTQLREYTKNNKQLETLNSVIQKSEQDVREAALLIQENQKLLSSKRKEYTKIEAEYRQLRDKRSSIFGDKNPKQESEAYQAQITLLEQLQEQHKTIFQQQQLDLQSQIQKLQQIQNQQKEGHDQLLIRKTALLEKTKLYKLTSIEQVQEQMLSPEEETSIRNQISELEKKINQVETVKKVNSTRIEKLQSIIPSGFSLESLKISFREQDQYFQKQLQEQGVLKEKLRVNAEKQANHGNLIKQRDKQTEICRRWAQLNDLIGSGDGKKFRTFAQGLTLERLILLANQHLQALNGRYLIYKLPEEDLRFVIIDTFQANHQRSVYTLSGGEKFLVSLALALGLSDLAGRTAQIRSLFIDEGFGTLDENSLDLAISTLENLQSTGKNIGVISHVPALKERISIQIQVMKQSDGFSKVYLNS